MLHEHNEPEATKQIVDLLINKEIQIAVVSDAGTPAISDPGYHLVQECILNNIKFYINTWPLLLLLMLLFYRDYPPSSFSFLGFYTKKIKTKNRLFSFIKA